MALDTANLKYIVFDLDDTLFDTKGLLIKPASIESCQAMVTAGLDTTVEKCLLQREQLTNENTRKNIYEALVNHFGVRPGAKAADVAKAGFASFHDRKIKEQITPFPDVFTTLERLKERFTLFLVTLGVPKTQAEKIDLLKIQALFNKIYFVDINIDPTKKRTFEDILKENRGTPDQFLSVGNRIDSEIRDAKELGMQTCLMEHGEYLHLKAQVPTENPDARIQKIGQLAKLLELETS